MKKLAPRKLPAGKPRRTLSPFERFLKIAEKKGIKTRAPVVAYKDAGLSRAEALDAETDRLKMAFSKWPHETARRQAEKNISWLYEKAQ